MKISAIHIYSFNGQRRDLPFKVDGLNAITGRSSTSKSSLPHIIQHFMRRSTINLPQRVLRYKVTCFAVIYQLDNVQVPFAKLPHSAQIVS